MAKVFLDAGHGGHDPGAVGNGLKEKDIALLMTFKIGDILKAHGVEVVYSRIKDEFLGLSERAQKANISQANVFVSIHCNSFSDPLSKGVEAYSYMNSILGAKLSKDIQESIITDKVYTVNRGTKTEDFAVLRLTNMPAVLVELAFISNTQDVYILKNRQDDLALAIAKGILKNIGRNYKEQPTEKIYKVQVGSFKDKKGAEKLAKELKDKGYEAIIVN